MVNAFVTFIQHEKLFSPADKILLTVSGGMDSIAMCELFHAAGFNFGIAHCNFKLRGPESDRDEDFVKELAKKYKATFHATSFDTSAYIKKNNLSIQEGARILRYQWFEKISKTFNYKYIATAHHSDDAVETFLINLTRGTGISGLHGILPKHGKLIRPMLFTSKKEIAFFVKQNKLIFREDASNASDKYLRNRIRQNIIPALAKINPSVNHSINETIKHLRDVESVYRNAIEKKRGSMIIEKKGKKIISISSLKKLNPLSAYLFEFLYPFGFNPTVIEEIEKSMDGISGKQFFSTTHRLIKDRNELIIEELLNEKKTNEIHIKKNTKEIANGDLHLRFGSINDVELNKLATGSRIANIDFSKLDFPLLLRKWKKGDIFHPIGMKGKKKLSDFFIDKKLSIGEKENTWILISGDEIVWVVGMRLDDRFKVTNKTKKIYFVEMV